MPYSQEGILGNGKNVFRSEKRLTGRGVVREKRGWMNAIAVLRYDKGPSFLCRGTGISYIEGIGETFHAMQ